MGTAQNKAAWDCSQKWGCVVTYILVWFLEEQITKTKKLWSKMTYMERWWMKNTCGIINPAVGSLVRRITCPAPAATWFSLCLSSSLRCVSFHIMHIDLSIFPWAVDGSASHLQHSDCLPLCFYSLVTDTLVAWLSYLPDRHFFCLWSIVDLSCSYQFVILSICWLLAVVCARILQEW